ncbi:MAG: terminase small subunit-like protein [Nitrosotalea sp.]
MPKPSTYTPEMGEEICKTVATSSEGLHALCKKNSHWPKYDTVFDWRLQNKDFREHYAEAKKHQAEHLIEEILTIADDGKNDLRETQQGRWITDQENINRAKLRIDTRKWIASKLLPHLYGEKVENTTNLNITTHEEWLERLK